ncbi:MAG: hypothetical protein IPO26_21095 [Saprospiraceae bacterium]|nr:hypothetical protein [Saprospiraceae bacterium]
MHYSNIGDETRDNDAINGIISPISLSSGQSSNLYDAGLVRYGKIGNRAWHDVNGNGSQDANEPGLAGVQIQLTGTSIFWDIQYRKRHLHLLMEITVLIFFAR